MTTLSRPIDIEARSRPPGTGGAAVIQPDRFDITAYPAEGPARGRSETDR